MSSHQESDVRKISSSAMDDWEDDLLRRYPEGENLGQAEDFRDYEAETRPCVREFYRLNHHKQTLQFAREKKAERRIEHDDHLRVGYLFASSWGVAHSRAAVPPAVMLALLLAGQPAVTVQLAVDLQPMFSHFREVRAN